VSDLSSSSKIVVDLMAGLLNKGYCVITDNFYTYPTLYKSLISQKNRRIWDCKIGNEGYAVSTEKGQVEEG